MNSRFLQNQRNHNNKRTNLNGKNESEKHNRKRMNQFECVSTAIPFDVEEQILNLLINSLALDSDDICGVDDFGSLVSLENILDSNCSEACETMAFTERGKLDQTEFDILCKEEDGRISLAYERLPGIPKKVADKISSRTHTLDLSYNNIKDLTFLSSFKMLHTLILDNNASLNEKTFPFLPSLRILWLNKCGIANIQKWIQRLRVCAPNIRQLSLMGNPGTSSLLNGGSSLENNDYLLYVIGHLIDLEYLDDVKITDAQRTQAQSHIGVYAMGGGPVKFMDRISNSSNILTLFKYDPKRHRPTMSTVLMPEQSLLRAKPSTSNGRQ